MKKIAFVATATLAGALLLAGPMACKKRGGGDETTTTAGGSSGAADTAKGKALFTTNCASCHGADGMGQTPTGKAVKARDLTQASTYKQGADVASVTKTIETGVKGTGMAAFTAIPAPDRAEIAKYVVTLQKK